MKNIIQQIIMVCVATAVFTSCIKADYASETQRPKPSKITITPDWSNIGEGITPPNNIKVIIGNNIIDLGDGTISLLDVGTYRVIVYNEVAEITVTPTTESREVTVMGGANARLSIKNGFIPTSHNWFFSGQIEITTEKDSSYAHTVVMNQQARELNFDFTIIDGEASRIKNITAELSGITDGWNLVADEPYGEIVKVAPEFTLEGNKLNSQVRLLGTKGEKQTLTLYLTFIDGKTQTIFSDVTTQLTIFNTNKRDPITLKGDISMPINTEQSGSIINWKTITGNIAID